MYICCYTHPDHTAISDFRKRFASEIASLFNQVLEIANEAGVMDLGSVFLDGTKIRANASKHHAYSYQRATEIKAQLEKEVDDLMKMAEEVESGAVTTINIPPDIKKEISLRTGRLQVLEGAIQDIVARAAARYAAEQEAYEAKLKAREQRERETGKKSKGKLPEPPQEGPKPKDQINLTDPESRIMPNSDKGFSQAYNCQACVEPKSMLIVEAHVTQNPNDKKEVEPALKKLGELPESLGKVNSLTGDAGYFSDDNVKACEDQGIEPFIATGRDPHHKSLESKMEVPQEPPADAPSIEKMRRKLKTPEGKAVYKLRKQIVEPVFGVIKSVIGMRQFSRRGFKNSDTEWNFSCMCYNIKKLNSLGVTLS
jgi:hypothetical protein